MLLPWRISVRFLLASCLIIFCQTSGFAENDSKQFVDTCRKSVNSIPEFNKSNSTEQRVDLAKCIAVIGTLLAVGPYLREDLKFCPDSTRPILGMAAMNKYAKAHPDVLKPEAPTMDRLSMLILAFREEWPCK